MSDELFEWEGLVPSNEQVELWKTLIFSDMGRPFLLAAATAHGHTISEGKIVDETGKPINSSSPVWDDIVHDAARQAQAERPLESWK